MPTTPRTPKTIETPASKPRAAPKTPSAAKPIVHVGPATGIRSAAPIIDSRTGLDANGRDPRTTTDHTGRGVGGGIGRIANITSTQPQGGNTGTAVGNVATAAQATPPRSPTPGSAVGSAVGDVAKKASRPAARPKTQSVPEVTVGPATGQASEPRVTIGRATGQGPQVVPVAGRAVNVIQFGSEVAQRGPAAPSLIITELTGLERKVTLGGRALPYKGSIKFASEMELDESRYTGFPRTTQTVLGAKENETRMNGMWKDRFLDEPTQASVSRAFSSAGDPSAIEISDTSLRTGKDLCELFESMVYSGSVFRVQWLHIRRVGRLTLFEQDWWNPHDVAFTMTWKWIGLDEQIGTPSPARTSLSGLSAAFNSSYAELHEATNFDDLEGIDPTFADSVDIAVGQIQAAVLSVSDSLDSRVAAITDTVDAIRRSASIATFIKDRAQELIDSLDSFVAPAMLVTPISVPSGDDEEPQLPTVIGFSGSTSGVLTDSLIGIDAGKAIAAACQSRAAVRRARQMRHVAARQRLAALKTLDADVIATTVMRDQSDLRDVARQFYGSPDDWERIRKFNGLCGSTVPAGTIVLVPTSRGPT
jgi:hypothetical protein